MMEAYRQLSAVTDYPLHVGVTEAGTYQMGLLKAAWASAGCCWRASAIPSVCRWLPSRKKEVEAGFNILRAVGFGHRAGGHHLPHLRTHQYPCTEIANEVEKRLQGYQKVHQGGRYGLCCQRPR